MWSRSQTTKEKDRKHNKKSKNSTWNYPRTQQSQLLVYTQGKRKQTPAPTSPLPKFTVVSFTTGKGWKPKRLSMFEGRDEVGSLHTTGCLSAFMREDILTHAPARTNPEDMRVK